MALRGAPVYSHDDTGETLLCAHASDDDDDDDDDVDVLLAMPS